MNGILETESQTEAQSVSNTHNKMRSCAERKRKYEKKNTHNNIVYSFVI